MSRSFEVGTRRLALAAAVLIASLALTQAAPVAAGTKTEQPADLEQLTRQALTAGAEVYSQGRFEQALEHFDEALRLARDRSSEAGVIEALTRRAETYKALGFQRKALDDLKGALGLVDEQGDVARLAVLSGILGDTYRRMGEPQKAEQQLKRCIALARQSGEQRTLAVAMNDLATLMMTTGRGKQALAAYQTSMAVAEKAGATGLAATSTVNAARLHMERGDAGAAAVLLDGALAKLDAAPAGHDKAFALIAVGSLWRDLPDKGAQISGRQVERAYRAYKAALAVAEGIGDLRSASYAAGFLGQLYEQAGRYEEAARLTSRALFDAETLDAPEIAYLWNWQMGRLLRATGDLDEAIAAYQRSVVRLQSIRNDFLVGFRGGRSPFRQAVEPVFLELADLLLRNVDGGDSNIRLVAARQTIEQLKAAELQDYFQDECVAELQAKIKPIDQLADRTAAIYPILLPDRLELLVSLPSGLKQITVDVPSDILTEQVRAYRNLLEKRTTRQYLRPARQLFDWLIRPVEELLVAEQVDTLVFVPDGPLRTVPMAALHDGEKFLISRYAVAVTPGLGLVDPRPTAEAGMTVLLSGLTEPRAGFAALPNVAFELSKVEEIFDGGTVLMDASFLLGNFEKKLTDEIYSVVHIASHGQFKAEAAESFLLAYDGKLTLDGLEAMVKQSRFRDEPIELLTLSACQTAAGDDRAALGLAGIAIKAGARSALATLWFINDRASTELVSEFYRQLLRPETTKARALQQAQLNLLSDPRYRHPGYWAPFLLIGNWL